ncbi:MAG: lamin tail domain-containing protein, partial [Acidobacteriota bacterium]
MVISQVYGGGGNAGAPWRNDFIELGNIGSTSVDLTGWAIHYASAAGTTWQRTLLSGSIAPGRRLLIQQASGGVAGAVLPAPDLTGSIALASTAGKIVLTRTATAITAGVACPQGPDVIDLVGYGTTSCFEGTGAAPAPGSTTAVSRIDRGCTDRDRNDADFIVTAPLPLSSAAPPTICGAPTSPAGSGVISPNPVQVGSRILIEVAVTPGTNPSSTGLTVTADLLRFGGPAAFALLDGGVGGDSLAGDNRFSATFQLLPNWPPGSATVDVTIRDGQGRQGQVAIPLTLVAPGPASPLLISQIFAAGGNSGASYSHDWVELFNRHDTPVDLSGWSIQYATATGSAWTRVDLSGRIGPGGYYLIRLAGTAPVSGGLPPPEATGAINLSSTAGKILLTRSPTLPVTTCPAGEARADLVGYGETANCFEGGGPAPAPGSTTALLRRGDGCRETDQNQADWALARPHPRNSGAPPRDCAGYFEAARGTYGSLLAGSLLIYPVYSSLSARPQTEETRLTLTNTSPRETVTVRLFWVDGGGTTTADAQICLTPNQTTSLLASEIDPDVGGYLIAVAVDPLTGLPVNFNYLVGDEYLRLGSGHSANLGATAIRAIEAQPVAVESGAMTAEIAFDGENYQPLPTTLALNHLALATPLAPAPESLLILERLEGSLATTMRTLGDLTGLLYDDRESAQSFQLSSSRRQLRLPLNDRTLRVTP